MAKHLKQETFEQRHDVFDFYGEENKNSLTSVDAHTKMISFHQEKY